VDGHICTLAGLVIGDCQDMDRPDVHITFSFHICQIRVDLTVKADLHTLQFYNEQN